MIYPVDPVRTYFSLWWQEPDFVDVLAVTELPPVHGGGDLMGAVELKIGETQVLGRQFLLADIELLWTCLARLVAGYRADGEAREFLPDQPGELRLERVAPGLVRITLDFGEVLIRKAVANEYDLLSALTAAGVEFFEKMSSLSGRGYPGDLRNLTGG
jgi:hypothetical protein